MSLSTPTQTLKTSRAGDSGHPAELSLRTMATQFAAAATTSTLLVTIDLPGPIVDRLAAGGLSSLRTRATVTWEKPARQSSLIGLGTAARLTGDRNSALKDAMHQIGEISLNSLVLTTHPAARPRFLGGGRFDPDGTTTDPAWAAFGGWQFVVPCFLLATEDGELSGSCTMSMRQGETAADIEARLARALDAALRPDPLGAGNARAAPALDPPEWQARVATALEEIERGQYQKVVLARRTRVDTAAAESIGKTLGKLARRYDNCYVFKFHTADADWLGASPELLVALEGGTVRAASLAGSRPRNTDPEEDRRRVSDLLADAKERAEHQYVVTALRESLAPLCRDLSSPAGPEVMTLANIHHLYTPVEGRVAPGTHVLDLVTAIHPTPAVGGWPRAVAVNAINRLEQLDRGWYSGPIGWMDFAGDGEFAVALRSGLVNSTEATLFAGAGIVEGSVPAGELAETETKLRPLREALGGN